MATSPRFAVRFRRMREGKTNYKKRVAMVKSGLPKIVVRKSNNYITVQFTKYETAGDRTLLTVNSSKLKKMGWNHNLKNTPAAYLTGLLAGTMAKQSKITEVISDIGLYSTTKGAKVFAALKGVADAGLKFSLGENVVPSAERIEGKHISAFMKKDIQKDFHAVKEKILK
jgi:large subunit ribosomal protein L18